jgi:hypothetical protein
VVRQGHSGHLDLGPVIKSKVLQVSVATIDRVLAAARSHIDVQRKRRKGRGRGRSDVTKPAAESCRGSSGECTEPD